MAVKVAKHARISLACFAPGEQRLRAAYLGRYAAQEMINDQYF
jgi:hypothetical protein